MFEQLKAIRVALAQITEQVDALEASTRHVTLAKHSDCVSTDCPIGHDTVLGYLAKHVPEVLTMIDYTHPNATARDGWWLVHRARERGLPDVYVSAPSVLRRAGIDRVRAYPIALLAQRFG